MALLVVGCWLLFVRESESESESHSIEYSHEIRSVTMFEIDRMNILPHNFPGQKL
jgi:hypothetical protein